MANRPTITDVAEKAGVSVATVDRVLNGRMNVRPETARSVYEAARAIGYHASSLIRQRIDASLPSASLGFLLQKPGQAFYRNFAAEIEMAAEATMKARVTSYVEFVDKQSPEEIAAGLERLSRRCDSIAATSLDHHAVTAAVENLKARGKPVFSLLSDFAQGARESYLGLNNMKVGRTAAWFLSSTASGAGKMALFVGSHRWHGHDLRETGFRSYFRQYAPQFTILDTLVNLETREVTEEAMHSLLRKHPDLKGVYVAGGGMEGAIDALRAHAGSDLPSVVVNELTPESTSALQDHLIVAAIATPLPALAGTLIDMMISAHLSGPSDTPGQIFLPFDIHVPESV